MATISRVIRLSGDSKKNAQLDCLIQMMVQPDSYLVSSGFLKSKLTSLPTDLAGNAIPWMTYSMIDVLKDRINRGHQIFEYGSGYSTIFFGSRAGKVDSVEYNLEWLKRVNELTADMENVQLIHREVGNGYVSCIGEFNQKYDIIVIDGRKRVDCALNAESYLNDGGVIILDDAERERYTKIFSHYAARNYRSLMFTGLKADSFRKSSTAVIYRKENCLGI